MAAPTPDQLHTLALEAEDCVEKFSTALAAAGANDKAVQAISQMADSLRQIVGMLGKSNAQQAAPPQTTDSAIGHHMAQRRAAAQQAAAGPAPAGPGY